MPPAPIAHKQDYALLLLLALIWSTSFLLIKVGVETIHPITLTLGRLVLGGALLGAIAWSRGNLLPRGLRQWGIAAFVGVIGNALPFTLIQWGEKTIDSGLAAIFMGVMPVWVAVLAHFLTNERLTFNRSIGVIMAFAGLIVLIGPDALGELGVQLIAPLAVVGGAICYAVNSVYVRRQGAVPLYPIAASSLFIGALLLLPVELLLVSDSLHSASLPSWLAMLILGVFHTGLAALIYFRLIARVGATLFSQVNYIIPVLGVFWGAILLNEQPGWQEGLALMMILGGLFFINQRARA